MTHRTSMEVQAALLEAAHAADQAFNIVGEVGRAAVHLIPADYTQARVRLRAAMASLMAAESLMDASARVDFVEVDGVPAKALPADFMYDRAGQVVRNVPHTQDADQAIQKAKSEPFYVFNRRGERVAVSIPAKE